MRVFLGQIVTGCILLAGVTRAEMQTWTSADGRTIQAEFVRVFGTSVTLKRADGATVSCQMASLNEASREQAKQLAEASKAGAVNGAGLEQAPASKPSTLKLSSVKASGIPSDEEIKAFLTEYKETPTSDETLEFYANFSVPSLKPDDLKSFTRKKKVPYRITMDLSKVKMVDGKRKSLRMDGQGYFVLLNEAGDVVDRQRESLGKLCPS